MICILTEYKLTNRIQMNVTLFLQFPAEIINKILMFVFVDDPLSFLSIYNVLKSQLQSNCIDLNVPNEVLNTTFLLRYIDPDLISLLQSNRHKKVNYADVFILAIKHNYFRLVESLLNDSLSFIKHENFTSFQYEALYNAASVKTEYTFVLLLKQFNISRDKIVSYYDKKFDDVYSDISNQLRLIRVICAFTAFQVNTFVDQVKNTNLRL